MNMVMTFILHPLSHYNSITEPRARFFLSLLEHLTIDFPSYFIMLGSKDLGFYVFRTLMCIVGKP